MEQAFEKIGVNGCAGFDFNSQNIPAVFGDKINLVAVAFSVKKRDCCAIPCCSATSVPP